MREKERERERERERRHVVCNNYAYYSFTVSFHFRKVIKEYTMMDKINYEWSVFLVCAGYELLH